MKDSAEILHSRDLAKRDPSTVWGWSSPAGKIRAAKRANLIISAGNLEPGMRVLELGCGNGIFTEYFAAAGIELIALDISVELLELAQERCHNKNITFFVSSVEELALNFKFDAIIGSSILHHLNLSKALPIIYDHS